MLFLPYRRNRLFTPAIILFLLSGALMAGCGQTSEVPVSRLDAIGTDIADSSSMEKSSPINDITSSIQEQTGMSTVQSDASKDKAFPTPGLHTLENFIATALTPVGTTMYVWGGGWNEEDTGAGVEARSIGPSDRWREFAEDQTSDYDHQKTRYQIHDGLDCSGYVGWVIYNTMETEDGKEGYVMKSTDTASTFASYGWGDFLPSDSVTDWLPGDIASMKGHVWISLGTCQDGSVLLVHSSPPGVRICGTSPVGQTSQAVELAKQFMSSNYPEWYARYPECSVSNDYLKKSGQMRWNTATFPDAKELRDLSPKALLERFLSEN